MMHLYINLNTLVICILHIYMSKFINLQKQKVNLILFLFT